MKRVAMTMLVLSLAFGGIANCLAAEKTNQLEKVLNLGLPQLPGQIPTYYSNGAKARAQKLEAAIVDMNAFFQKRLGIRTHVTLAVLDSNDWSQVSSQPYGLPNVDEDTSVIFMPATSGGLAFHQMMGRRDAIPADVLKVYLETNHTTFEAVADEFVDVIGFHELGHKLCNEYGINPRCHWLNEFVASYFDYAYISERRPESKKVFDLLGRPSKLRPKNTTLADFERLYEEVDDYGWYQGMFETRIRELYPQKGLKFLKDLHKQFPAAAGHARTIPVPNPVPPEQALGELEKIAPGFETWAKGFQ
jgi:hypothetical protein